MRNFYKALGLQRLSRSAVVQQAVDAISPDQLPEEDDMQQVMMNDKWRNHYRRTHLQYEAIAAALDNPAMRDIEHTHNWDRRVVEFEPDQDNIEL